LDLAAQMPRSFLSVGPGNSEASARHDGTARQLSAVILKRTEEVRRRISTYQVGTMSRKIEILRSVQDDNHPFQAARLEGRAL
jgi:hypothetical protein